MRMLHAVWERTERVAAAGRLPVLVFDLDSTLFDTAARNLRIAREFADAHGDPVWREAAASLTLTDFGWSVAAPFTRLGCDDPSTLSALQTFWAERFFTDAYVREDHATAGAPAFVRGCYERGGFCYYLTGRHQGGMEVGTLEALRDRGFPVLRGRVALHLKPSFHLQDKAFKDSAIREIADLRGDVVATFENEPGNANLFHRAFPDALHFLIGGVHSPDAEPGHPELHRAPDFHLG